MNKNKNLSLSLSILLSFLTALLILGTFVSMPFYIEWKCTNTLSGFTGNLPTLTEKIAIYTVGYLLLCCAAASDVLLIRLLFLIKDGKVFTESTVRLLKYIACFIMAVGALFILLTPYFTMACAVGFMIVFVGVVVLVVRTIIDEATRIKSENDFTI